MVLLVLPSGQEREGTQRRSRTDGSGGSSPPLPPPSARLLFHPMWAPAPSSAVGRLERRRPACAALALGSSEQRSDAPRCKESWWRRGETAAVGLRETEQRGLGREDARQERRDARRLGFSTAWDGAYIQQARNDYFAYRVRRNHDPCHR